MSQANIFGITILSLELFLEIGDNLELQVLKARSVKLLLPFNVSDKQLIIRNVSTKADSEE